MMGRPDEGCACPDVCRQWNAAARIGSHRRSQPAAASASSRSVAARRSAQPPGLRRVATKARWIAAARSRQPGAAIPPSARKSAAAACAHPRPSGPPRWRRLVSSTTASSAKKQCTRAASGSPGRQARPVRSAGRPTVRIVGKPAAASALAPPTPKRRTARPPWLTGETGAPAIAAPHRCPTRSARASAEPHPCPACRPPHRSDRGRRWRRDAR